MRTAAPQDFAGVRAAAPENNCVEVADMADNGRAVRDSKNQRGPHLTFTHGAWQAFLQGVKRQELDR
ncbi:DUF397 domain-containing protein [Streptomyces sp. NBS 14/10]|uniref:DUF397 domain-containing protein n=1 Tax=Streptomyces sp. NBS 14/10 TaxID=1945643 RepID=UPI000B7F396D|nr:DUF397 domain-containing protein [Streptomyces sp. NBS 14/10]KAK1181642.1 DUF397 domain-containing protein [Streptomyces sp. NBS 14/10]